MTTQQQYRDLLAKQLRQAIKGRPRKALLNKERATNAYGRAFQAHALSQIAARTRTDLAYDRSDLYQSLEPQIGHTPLVELSGLLPNSNRLFIKQEYDNRIGHSHYDRVYISLLKEKERLGLIRPGMNLFETTSGTAGVSFAAVGRELGYRCHVAIPAGGEKAREKAIERAGAQLYLTPEEDYVNGFLEFVRTFSRAHPDYVFVNHSMGNILGKGYGVNETAIDAMEGIADEISSQLRTYSASKLDFVMSALGNGTNTLGLARRFKVTEPETRLWAYEMVLSGVGYSKKYGDDQYRRLLDPEQRFSARDFVRHNMPGTSYPGVDFPAAREALSLVARVVLIADASAEREYLKVTKNQLPPQVIKTEFDKSDRYGRSTEAGISVAQRLAEQEQGKNFVVIGYDTADRYDHPAKDRYDHPAITSVRRAKVAIFGGQERFGMALQRRLAQTNHTDEIRCTTDKQHNSEIASNADVIVVAVQPHKVGALLNEIGSALKPEAQIVSFAARYPLKSLYEATGRPAARAMADPWWNVSAIMPGAGFSEEHHDSIFAGLTKKQTIRLKTDKDMDDFTTAISYAFVVLLAHRYRLIQNSDEHFEFIAPRIGLSRAEINSFLPKNDPDELISLAATKGGVSEAIMKTIASEPHIKPSDLFSRCSEVLRDQLRSVDGSEYGVVRRRESD